jgi:hypothetical protein
MVFIFVIKTGECIVPQKASSETKYDQNLEETLAHGW